MKKIFIAALIFSVSITAIYATDLKIGIVDYMKVYTEAPQGQKTLQQLKAQLQPKVQNLQLQQQDLMKEMEKLEKNKPTLSMKDYNQQKNALEKKGQSFQIEVQSLRQKEMENEQRLAQSFQVVLTDAIKEVGSQGNYDLILNSQAAPYTSNKFDNVTYKVLDIMQKTGSDSKQKN